MIKLFFNNKVYFIQKDKIILIIEKLSGNKISENEIEKYMSQFNLYDEYFLENINKL